TPGRKGGRSTHDPPPRRTGGGFAARGFGRPYRSPSPPRPSGAPARVSPPLGRSAPLDAHLRLPADIRAPRNHPARAAAARRGARARHRRARRLRRARTRDDGALAARSAAPAFTSYRTTLRGDAPGLARRRWLGGVALARLCPLRRLARGLAFLDRLRGLRGRRRLSLARGPHGRG